MAERAAKMTEVCQAEAFFRPDPSMHMSDTNIKVDWIDTSFPDKRGVTFSRVEDKGNGTSLPDRCGEFQPTSRIEDKYQKR